jgi:electron transfer flavoprotein alpha subunit
MIQGAPILVVAEHAQGQVLPSSYELIHLARQLQRLHPAPIQVLLVGDALQAPAAEMAQQAGLAVIAIEVVPGPNPLPSDVTIGALWRYLEGHRPAFLCMPSSARGLECAPALAARLEAAHVTGVVDVMPEGGTILMGRLACDNQEIHFMETLTPTVVLNPLPGAFAAEVPEPPPAPGTVSQYFWPREHQRIVNRGLRPAETDFGAIVSARVVVAAGNGIGARENLALIQRLAAVFPHAAVGGSRILCDRGWLNYDQQIGISGATVAPALYVACGISGAPQHMAGMRGSGLVVAINTDSRAAILHSADVCIVEDLTRFIPVFLALVEEMMPGGR